MPQMPTLPELVGLVLLDGIAEPRDPIRQIAAAERIAGELNVLGDSLVGFFVELARAEGCSWADIGAPRGLSRQGAQQRYAPLIAQLTVDELIRTGVVQRFDDDALDSAALKRTRVGSATTPSTAATSSPRSSTTRPGWPAPSSARSAPIRRTFAPPSGRRTGRPRRPGSCSRRSARTSAGPSDFIGPL